MSASESSASESGREGDWAGFVVAAAGEGEREKEDGAGAGMEKVRRGLETAVFRLGK